MPPDAVPSTPMPEAKTEALQTACAALRHALKVGNDAHRCFAVETLGRIGCVDALDDVIAALRDEDADVRVAAADALGVLGDPRAGAPLLESLNEDPEGEVKVKAVEALGTLGVRDAEPLLRALVAGRAEEEIAWDEDAYYAEDWDDWLDVQIAAITALGRIGADGAARDIAAAMLDADAQDLEAVGTAALGRLGPSGIETLKSLLAGGRSILRRAAARALAECGDASAVEALAAVLDDPDVTVGRAALEALVDHRPDHPSLTERLVSGSAETRAYLIARLPVAAAEQYRAWIAEPEPQVRVAALERLAAEPGVAIDVDLRRALFDACFAQSDDVAAAAVTTLGARFGASATGPLDAVLREADRAPAVHRAAVDALGGTADGAAMPPLVTAAGSEHREVRLGAMLAIAALAGSEIANDGPLTALHQAARGELIEVQDQDEDQGSPETDEERHEAEAVSSASESETVEVIEHTSTLDAILDPSASTEASQPAPEEPVVLTDDDLEYLALAQSRVSGRRRVALEPDVSPGEDVRRLAIRLLGEFDDKATLNALMGQLDGSNAERALPAIESLQAIGARGARLPAAAGVLLASLVDHTDILLRHAAVRALAHCKGKAAQAACERLLDHDDHYVRIEALRSFAALGGDVDTIRAALDDGEPTLRSTAARLLAVRQYHALFDDLVAFAIDRDGTHSREAASLLKAGHKDAATTRFAEILYDEGQQRIWRGAIEALDELHSTRRDLLPN